MKTIGISTFGAMSEHAKGKVLKHWMEILRAAPNQTIPCFAVLMRSFGVRKAGLVNLMKAASNGGKRQFICEIHLLNGASRRKPGGLHSLDINPKQNPSQFNAALIAKTPALKKKLIDLLNEVRDIVDPWVAKKGAFILSLGLEDDYSDDAAKALYSMIKDHWPYEWCRNPVNNNNHTWKPAGAWFEKHGYRINPTAKMILNGDGQDVDFCPPYVNFNYPDGDAVSKEEFRAWRHRGIYANSICLMWVAKHQGLHLDNPGKTIDREFRVDAKDLPVIKDVLFK